MKYPFPRSTVRFYTFGVAFLIGLAWLNLGQSNPSTRWANWFFGGSFLLAFGAMAIYSLVKEHSFVVKGERQKFDVTLTPGQVLEIGPISGILGAALLLEIENKLPREYLPGARPFVLSQFIPHDPAVHYRVRLLSDDDKNCVTEEFTEWVGTLNQAHPERQTDMSWEKIVPFAAPSYRLQLEITRVEFDPREIEKKSLQADSVPVHVKGRLDAALSLRTLKNYRWVSLKIASFCVHQSQH